MSSGVILSNKQSLANALEHSDENSTQLAVSSKKGQRLAKKTKTNQSKITKANLNSKAINKCYSPVKMSANRKTNSAIKATNILANTEDDLFILKDSSNLKKTKNDFEAKPLSSLLEEESNSMNQVQENFVHECEEFDQVLKKIKFKEQFKREFEAQLNSRMTKETVEPLFNTLSVFQPLVKEDDYCQSEPSMYNSPLIAEPSSLAFSNKVDMPCATLFCDDALSITNSMSPSSCLSNDLSPASCLSTSSLSTEISNDDMSFNQPSFNLSYDISSPTESNLSNSGLGSCDLFESTDLNYIPEIDVEKTKFNNSIFFPLPDDLNSGYYMSYEEDSLQGKTPDYSYLAPQAGDSTMSLDVSLDFDDLPPNLDAMTEKLIKEISFNDNLNIVQNNDINLKTNSTIQYKNSNKIFDYNYSSKGKSLKIPNHFNFDDETEVIKKPRTTFNLNSPTNQPLSNQQSKFSALKNSSVLLNLLVNGEDSYLNK